MTEFVSPVGRFVQGSLTLENKIDPQTGKPKLGEDGQPIKENFIALAVRKDDPGLPAFMQLCIAQAQADFPHLFQNGQMVRPDFAWKMVDGDGIGSDGKPLSDKPGFAGCIVFKMGTRYLPKCFHAGKYDPTQMIQNPSEVIKRGFYIRVAGTVRGNGVTPQDKTQKPGLFISPNLVELIAYGQEIVGGPDANKVFGGAGPVTALPAGASTTPLAPTGAVGNAPPMPTGGVPGLPAVGSPVVGSVPGVAGVPVAAPAGIPATPGAVAAPVGLPAMPGVASAQVAAGMPAMPAPLPVAPAAPAAPVYTMTAAAMGNTREALIAQGWTDDTMIANGLMVRQ